MRRIKLMVTVLLLGGFITSFSETLLNNALPTIMREVHVSQMTAQWLSTGYLLAAGIMMPVAAYFTNRFRLRPLFIGLMLVFLLGTVTAVTASSFAQLFIGRIIQALSVGISMPLTQNVISLLFPPEQRGIALGLAGVVINLGPAMGPTISGYIVDHYSWRMLFIILIPLALLVILLGLVFVKNVTKTVADSVDTLSVVYSSLGLGSLLYGLSLVGVDGGVSLTAIITVVVGVAVLVLFVRRQFRLTKPLLELRAFKAASFSKVVVVALFSAISLMGPELIVPLYNQNIHGLTAMTSGLLLLPGALLMAILSPISGKLYDLFGIKALAYVGYGLTLIATIPMLWFDRQTSLLTIILSYAARVAGLTLVYMQVNVNGLNALPKDYVVHGSTIIVTIQQVASSFGTALLVAIVSFVQRRQGMRGVPADTATAMGYHWAFIVVFIISAICLLGSLLLKNKTTPEVEAL